VLIPLLTRAWARAFPWATVGLIAANTAVAVLVGYADTHGSSAYTWALKFGEIDPVTWLTCAFTHADPIHLVGNMVFLWAFGFIVEGLLGWYRFLVLYVVVAMLPSALMQLMMLHRDFGAAVGASAAITGLMSLAALWAPRQEIRVLFVFLPFIRVWDMRVLRYCALMIGLDVIAVLLFGSFAGGPMAHVLGGAAGAAVGVAMLQLGWVDTGGEDLLAKQRPTRPCPRPRPPVADPRVAALLEVREALRAGEAERADALYLAAQQRDERWVAPRGLLTALIDALVAAGRRDLALPHMEQLLAAYAGDSVPLRLKVARELVRARRPRAAADHLAELADRRLTRPQRELRDFLARRARALQAQGALELE
jgi:membrane associated rhomboid family serine protease